MISRRFRINCLVRVLLVSATCLVLAYLIQARKPLSSVACAGLLLLQVGALVRHVEQTNRRLALVFESVADADFARLPDRGPRDRTFREVSDAFHAAVDSFRGLHDAREEELQFHQAVIQHIGTGVLAFDDAGEVKLVNAALRRLLDLPRVRHLGDLAAAYPLLHRQLARIQPGQRDLITILVADDPRQVAVQASRLRLRTGPLTLVSLQDIRQELNAKEIDAWMNLIRVLTHEIKNSLTPIGSLAESVERMLASTSADSPDRSTGDRERIDEALRVIRRRSQGLLDFVDSYRGMTSIPAPDPRPLRVRDLLARIGSLVAAQTDRTAIALRCGCEPPDLVIAADPRLLEQVLINLVINALDATTEVADPRVALSAGIDPRGRPCIEVRDNGVGIQEEALEKVFLPFYSTKRDGSGIGLSWSRQVVRMQGGELTVRSSPETGTVFTLRFPEGTIPPDPGRYS